jgi:hypothetical protein
MPGCEPDIALRDLKRRHVQGSGRYGPEQGGPEALVQGTDPFIPEYVKP